MRIYSGVAPNVDAFNAFFFHYLLPNQTKHGARLVGRWQTEDDRIVAIWAYDSRDAYERIEDEVRRDPLAAEARSMRESLPRLYESVEETFMVPTVSL
jgi:hypothetical protein